MAANPFGQISQSALFASFFRRHRKTVGVFVFSILTGFTVYRLSYAVFTIRKIVVLNPDIDVTVNEKALNRHLFFFPSGKFRTELLARYPVFADVIVRKRFPDTLELDFVLRKGVADVISRDRSVLVDEAGVVLGASEIGREILPVIDIGSDSVQDGGRFEDPAFGAVLSFLSALGPETKVIRITREEELTLRVKTGESDILITQNADMSATASTLQILLARFRMKGRMPVFIDLRFDKPVIRY